MSEISVQSTPVKGGEGDRQQTPSPPAKRARVASFQAILKRSHSTGGDSMAFEGAPAGAEGAAAAAAGTAPQKSRGAQEGATKYRAKKINDW